MVDRPIAMPELNFADETIWRGDNLKQQRDVDLEL